MRWYSIEAPSGQGPYFTDLHKGCRRPHRRAFFTDYMLAGQRKRLLLGMSALEMALGSRRGIEHLFLVGARCSAHANFTAWASPSVSNGKARSTAVMILQFAGTI